ncbi:MAG: metalloprotease TldD [Sutterella sp.]|nr:metalloprotease TldD [Sutterella sp.]
MTHSLSSLERLAAAQALFYSDTGLDDDYLLRLVGRMSAAGTDWADIYLQQTVSRSWILDEGAVKTGSYSIDRGAGLRTVCGETSALAYTDVLTPASLREAALTAAGGFQGNRKIPLLGPRTYTPVCGTENAASNEYTPQALDLIRRTDAMARSADSRVTDVVVTLQCEKDAFLVARLDGCVTGDVRPMVYLSISLIVTENGRRERASAGGGSRSGLGYFTDELVSRWVRSAVDEAIHNLRAKPAPAGIMPVVLGPGWPGILLHEAVGHGLEGDFIRKGTSAFTDLLGKRVASPGVTVIDDGTLSGKRGSVSIDDEGTPSSRTVLIEDGILTGFMHDLTSARILGALPTGNGRRESFATLPLPRMTNTFMQAGSVSPDDIIRSVKKGIYASNFSGGQVDITSGKFVFAMSRAWLIENGRLTYPVKGAMLSGSGPEALKHIPLIGNDPALDEGTGQCGKDGQQIPVGVGMPTVRIDALTVGGTELSGGV